MRIFFQILTVCWLVACASPSPSDPRALSPIIYSSIDFDAEPSITPQHLAQALIGSPVQPAPRLEFTADGKTITAIDLGDFQYLCGNQSGPIHRYLLFVDDVLVGEVPSLPTILRLPRLNMSGMNLSHPLSGHATSRDAPDDLPLLRGMPSEVNSIIESSRPVHGSHSVVCFRTEAGAAAERRGDVTLHPLSPSGLLAVAETRSRLSAREQGRVAFAELRAGTAIVFDDFVSSHRRLARAHDAPGSSYQVITMDLGGAAQPGRIAQPRDVGFIGVRNGIVEWKSWENGDQMNLGRALCRTPDQREGPVRPGCSDTGYYFP